MLLALAVGVWVYVMPFPFPPDSGELLSLHCVNHFACLSSCLRYKIGVEDVWPSRRKAGMENPGSVGLPRQNQWEVCTLVGGLEFFTFT